MILFGLLLALVTTGYFFGFIPAFAGLLAVVALSVAGTALTRFPKISLIIIFSAAALIHFRDWNLFITGIAAFFILFFLICDGDSSGTVSNVGSIADPIFNINGMPMNGQTDAYGNSYGSTYNDPHHHQ